jgi:hypothetical protein
MLLVDDLLLLPARGLMSIFNRIAEAVDEEMSDEGKVKEELMRLHMMFETDEITEEEYNKGEHILLKRLEAIRKYKEDK